MQESELYQRWFTLARSKKALQTGGHRLQILQEGELNTHRGPDIRHACFELDGRIYQGAVEFHIQARDWYRHHHHLDQAFGDVLLHLVAANKKNDPLVHHQGSGAAIPTLLFPLGDVFATNKISLCSAAGGDLHYREMALKDLALRRFAIKTRQFTQQLSNMDVDEVYYIATMRAWGYPYNRLAFSVLSRKFPWSKVWQWLRQWGYDEQGLYAILAGAAGFLADQTSDEPYLNVLQERFRLLKNRLELSAMDPAQWVWAGCRPANHPHLRLAGMARLLNRSGDPFWRQAQEILSARRDDAQALKQIKDLFAIPLHPYWESHYALGQASSQLGRKQYFGAQRVQEWLINVLLPITAAQAGVNDSLGFTEYLQAFFLNMPQKYSYGQFEGAAIMAGLPRKVYVNQGMIQLRDQFCRKRGCSACPLLLSAAPH